MSSNPLLLRHASPIDLAGQADELQAVRNAAYLRGVEIMFLELRELFHDHSEITSVCFDQDGDVDSFPAFTCLAINGNDLSEDIEDVELLAEKWNDRIGPATSGFLTSQEGRQFHRAHFEQDVIEGCRKMERDELISLGDDFEQWLGSFSSHLSAIALDLGSAPSAPSSPKPRL
jgi:hypothetical protein